jgi:hypothetical protein
MALAIIAERHRATRPVCVTGSSGCYLMMGSTVEQMSARSGDSVKKNTRTGLFVPSTFLMVYKSLEKKVLQ